MGLSSALVQLSSISKSHIGISYSLSILFGLIIGVVFYFGSTKIALYFDQESLIKPMQFFSIFFPIYSFNSISTALLQRKLKFSVLVKISSIAYFFGYGLTSITLAFMGYGLWSLVYGQLAILLVTTLLLLYFQKPIFSLNFKKKTVKELIYFGSGLTIDLNFNFLAENADNIIVAKLLGASSLGIYSRAFQFLALPATFFGKIYDQVLFPVLSSIKEETKMLTSFYIFSISFCLTFLLPVSLFLLINAELIVLIVLGEKWLEVILPFQILIVGLCLRFGTRINKSFLKSLGLVYHGAKYQFFFALFMIVNCLVGAHYFGLPGVAAAVFITTLFNYFQVAFRIQKKIDAKYSYFISLHLRSLLTTIPFVIIIIGMATLHLGNSLILLLISTIALIAVLLWVTRFKKSLLFESHNRKVLKLVLNNLPTKLAPITRALKLDQ